MINEYETVSGMRIGKENQKSRGKSLPAPFCPPQIPHGVTLDRNSAARLESRTREIAVY
jgi:hypothetical protein